MTTYKTKALAEAALAADSRKNKQQAQAVLNGIQPTAKATSGISHVSIARTEKVGGGCGIVIKWRCSVDYEKLASSGFRLDIQQKNRSGGWSQYGNGVQTSSRDSKVKQGRDVYYTYSFGGATDDSVHAYSVRVQPVSGMRTHTREYSEVVQSASGRWKIVSNGATVSREVPYFTVTAWSDKVTLSPAPGYENVLKQREQEQQDKEAEKLRLAREAPAKPGRSTVALETDGKPTVTFKAIAPDTADTCRLLYRYEDGAWGGMPYQPFTSHTAIGRGATTYHDQSALPGHQYRYLARAHNNRNHDGLDGTWDAAPSLPGDLSDPVNTPPVQVQGLSVRAYGEDGALVEFYYPGYPGALTSVKVYYADDLTTLQVNRTSCSSVTVSSSLTALSMYAIVTGLDAGKTWYFAVHLETGSAAVQKLWCTSYTGCAIAATPEPPTLLPLPKSAYIGDAIDIGWAHNCPDGAAQTDAEVVVKVTKSTGVVQSATYHPSPTGSESLRLTLSSGMCDDTSDIAVKVRTKGAGKWGGYCSDVHVTAYARVQANLSMPTLSMGDSGPVASALPLPAAFSVSSTAGRLSQSVVQWEIVLSATSGITYIDRYGREGYVAAGEVVYRRSWSAGDEGFSDNGYSITATDGVFVDGGSYALVLSALMDSGLTADPDRVEFGFRSTGGFPVPDLAIEATATWGAMLFPTLVEPRAVPEGDGYVLDEAVLRMAFEAFPSGSVAVAADLGDGWNDVHVAIPPGSAVTGVSCGGTGLAEGAEWSYANGVLSVLYGTTLAQAAPTGSATLSVSYGGAPGAYEVVVSYVASDEARELVVPWDGSAGDLDVAAMGEWDSVESVGWRAAGATGSTALGGEAHPEPKPVDDATIAVYRMNADGSLSQLGSEADNAAGLVFFDPFPPFGEMAYRVVANSKATDEVTYSDAYEPNGWKSVLVQWAVSGDGAGALADAESDGELTFGFEWVELPHNVGVQQSSAKDVALKDYVGRAHPLALYGTQVGESGSWTCQFPKREGTWELSQLRKLSSWMGPCWVREATGLSYPANVDVTLDRRYDSEAVDVTLEVTRLDGDGLD